MKQAKEKEDEQKKLEGGGEATGQEEEVSFVQYEPAHLRIGVPHPDKVVSRGRGRPHLSARPWPTLLQLPQVENASRAAVRPPEITYELRLPQEVIDRGYLSNLQLESVVYAAQQHEKFDGYDENRVRKGFFIGDGAGVGKGRQLAGIIVENLLHGR